MLFSLAVFSPSHLLSNLSPFPELLTIANGPDLEAETYIHTYEAGRGAGGEEVKEMGERLGVLFDKVLITSHVQRRSTGSNLIAP